MYILVTIHLLGIIPIYYVIKWAHKYTKEENDIIYNYINYDFVLLLASSLWSFLIISYIINLIIEKFKIEIKDK